MILVWPKTILYIHQLWTSATKLTISYLPIRIKMVFNYIKLCHKLFTVIFEIFHSQMEKGSKKIKLDEEPNEKCEVRLFLGNRTYRCYISEQKQLTKLLQYTDKFWSQTCKYTVTESPSGTSVIFCCCFFLYFALFRKIDNNLINKNLILIDLVLQLTSFIHENLEEWSIPWLTIDYDRQSN